MRCKNCGWENPEGAHKCERCSSPLAEAAPQFGGNGNAVPPEYKPVLNSTVRESDAVLSQNGQAANAGKSEGICQNCGYSISMGMNVCPQCGTPQHQAAEKKPAHKQRMCPKCGGALTAGARFCPSCGQKLIGGSTVNAWDNPQSGDFCSLRPIAWSKEDAQYEPISFSGERIVLNRANTDPNNQSITSHEQAVLTTDGTDWFIEDLSEQHSTMLRVSRKTKLQSGDIIALGNRLFEFKS